MNECTPSEVLKFAKFLGSIEGGVYRYLSGGYDLFGAWAKFKGYQFSPLKKCYCGNHFWGADPIKCRTWAICRNYNI